MFPFVLEGELVVGAATVDGALSSVRSALEEASASDLVCENDELRFRGGMFRFVLSWNVLVPITSGRVVVWPDKGGVSVAYRVTLYESWVTAFLLGAVSVPGVVAGRPEARLLWLWLIAFVAVNIATTAWRFPRFLERSVARS